MTTIPKLVTDIIDWYQWKAKIKLVNNEYHSSYFYNESNGYSVHVYTEYVYKDKSRGYVRKYYECKVNYRKIGNHSIYDNDFYRVRPISILRKQSRYKYRGRIPPTYCHCKLCEDDLKQIKHWRTFLCTK